MASETITATGGLQITVDRGEDGTLVRLSGRLSITGTPRTPLALLQAEPPETVIVDLRETPYIDLSGIATLIEALKIARDRSTTLRLQGLHGCLSLLHFLEVTGCCPCSKGWRCKHSIRVEGVLMATVLDGIGQRTLTELDYVGSLNIQLWATLRAMVKSLPFVGNRHRWQASVRQDDGDRR